MRAQDVMTHPVVTVTPETTAKRAAELLSRNGFTALPVVGDDGELIGIVTEADLIGDRFPADARRVSGRADLPGATVAEVMTTPVTAMSRGTDLSMLVRSLLDSRIRVMPIVDGSRLVGIVTRGDIVRVFARSDAEIAADVRHHLAIYGGPDRWQVRVRDGVVHIVDEFDNDIDRHVAAVLAEAVPGVVSATVVTRDMEQAR
ncbi:CBS domain-containing protein [Amycolatopsis pithecellobii]|uniref:CBS domain-containing protein n=1 Tax=Amycolatopsis pithecellobii TaxID=664692 RepID=A0A6N7ZCT3_9PSEU|nr:CBS domain-containing protein [Amycolatopsis pithecellobii]MTD59604.1 CBS domain-containing protein [Amycolatopsis pithecellobii]